jgi:hypothetical protein
MAALQGEAVGDGVATTMVDLAGPVERTEPTVGGGR